MWPNWFFFHHNYNIQSDHCALFKTEFVVKRSLWYRKLATNLNIAKTSFLVQLLQIKCALTRRNEKPPPPTYFLCIFNYVLSTYNTMIYFSSVITNSWYNHIEEWDILIKHWKMPSYIICHIYMYVLHCYIYQSPE